MKSGIRSILGILTAGTLLVPPFSFSAGKPYNGAEYRTKASYLYGRFEVRMKSVGREGTLASFFTYNDDYPNTVWNEIDIEILGRYSDDVQFNTITQGQVSHVSHQYVGFDPSQGFHVYGIEWTPTSVAWFIDSIEVYRQSGSHIATLNLPQKIMMNVWIPIAPSWVGPWNDAVLPAFASYDWVSYASYTPGTGTLGTGNNFTPQWRDSLNSWDSTRWDLASHTWDGNNCDMIPANIAFQNGTMILCITKSTDPGYTDHTAPSALWARVEGDSIRIRFSEEVEQSSAELPSNYILVRGSVSAAMLFPDSRTLLLTVPGIDTSTASSLILKNIRDRWSVPNAMAPSVTTLIRSPRLSFPFKINIGGNDTLGYQADQDWSPSVEYGKLDGWTGSYSGATISGTNEQEIYRTEAAGMCEYKVRVPNGKYLVTLMLAENSLSSPGLRSMTIGVEGKLVATNLDLVSQIGYRTAYVRAAIADVSDGVLDIHFQGLINVALLNGLTLFPIATEVNDRSRNDPHPEMLRMLPNFPNPFNGGTTLSFNLPERGEVSLKVFDVLGREVRELGSGVYPIGTSRVYWDARDSRGYSLPSGIYYCVVKESAGWAMQKVICLK